MRRIALAVAPVVLTGVLFAAPAAAQSPAAEAAPTVTHSQSVQAQDGEDDGGNGGLWGLLGLLGLLGLIPMRKKPERHPDPRSTQAR